MNQFNQLDAQDEVASLAMVSPLEVFLNEKIEGEKQSEKNTCAESKLD